MMPIIIQPDADHESLNAPVIGRLQDLKQKLLKNKLTFFDSITPYHLLIL